MVTLEQIGRVVPKAPVEWCQAILDLAPKYGIDTPVELASFVAQLAHESVEFSRLEESLYYSNAARLVSVWPSRFAFPGDGGVVPAGKVDPNLYIRNPQVLANFVYANRMGNGNPLSGDGWRYRGRGPIQLTGKNNYMNFEVDFGYPVLTQPDLLLTPECGIASACWYWKMKDLDRYDDDESARAETKLINGGAIGLAERQAYLDRAIREFTP